MPTPFLIMLIIVCVIAVAVPLIILFGFVIPNYKSILKRAKEIDPTVKTIAEAQYVLQKNIMESMKNNSEHSENKEEK